MDIAQHIRIFDKTPSDELVEKRIGEIDMLAGKYQDLASVANILQLAADLTRVWPKAAAFQKRGSPKLRL